MLQYLVILLSDESVAYCHAENLNSKQRLMTIDTLQSAILFGMRENLSIQYVLPDKALPEEYYPILDSIDHSIIRSCKSTKSELNTTSEVLVANSISEIVADKDATIVLRLTMHKAIEQKHAIADLLSQVKRLNLCYTDTEKFYDEQQDDYKTALKVWGDALVALFTNGEQPQFNILTDRLQLTSMQNCDAGISNISIAPNGKFYLCPAFYYEEQRGTDNMLNHAIPSHDFSVGNIATGLLIRNKQLLQLEHAPICRVCDAYHCHRCIWLNQKMTFDANTPCHEQCVVVHLERNACRDMLAEIRKQGEFLPDLEIKELTYLDPFDEVNHWK